MQHVQVFLVVAGAVLVTAACRRRGWPAPLVLVGTAIVVAFLPWIPRFEVHSELLLEFVLPPLLYSAALSSSYRDFRASLNSITRLGVGLVIVTALAVAAVFWWLEPAAPFAVALVLGAVVAPPDAVAASAVGRRLGLPRRVMTVLSGESLINDATSLTLYKVAIAGVATGAWAVRSAFATFGIAVVVGVAVGLALGWLVHRIRLHLDDPVVASAIGVLTPFAAYWGAEALQGSGVLAVVSAGLLLGHTSPRAGYATRLYEGPLWSTLDILLESFTFALIGLQLPWVVRDVIASDQGLRHGIVVSFAVLATAVLIRPIYIFATARFDNLRLRGSHRPEHDSLSARESAVVSWAGMRGVVTLAAAAAVPATIDGEAFPERATLQLAAYSVAIGTLLLQGLTLPWVIRKLKVGSAAEIADDAAQEAATRVATADAVQRVLEAQRAEWTAAMGEENAEKAISRLSAMWRGRAAAAAVMLDPDHADDHLPDDVDATEARHGLGPAGRPATGELPGAEEASRAQRLRREIVAAQRDVLMERRDAGELDETVMRRMLRELDLEDESLASSWIERIERLRGDLCPTESGRGMNSVEVSSRTGLQRPTGHPQTTSTRGATVTTTGKSSSSTSTSRKTRDVEPAPASTTSDAIDQLVANATKALAEYARFTQEDVDQLVKKGSVAALDQHGVLAQLAVQETGRGVFEDKAVKNIFACEHVTNSMANLKTVGVINRDDLNGITEIAEPVGVICGVTPVTNPTSTAIFKSLISLKTRNPIIFAFHPSAQASSVAAARVVRDAAIAAGAPEHCIQWVESPSIEATNALMNHPGVSMILATGGNAMVRAAYSCGKPALGVGAGNVPAYIEKSAKLKRAVNDVVLSKAFDNGMICASEQAVILDDEIYDAAMAEFAILHAYRVTPTEKTMLEKFIFGVEAGGENCGGAKLNASVVGQSPQWIAEKAGFTVPADTSIILAEVSGVGPNEPLTREKLAPVLAVLRATTTEQGISLAEQMVEFDGLGHSAAIHTRDHALTERFGSRVKAIRVIENAPASLGGIGDIYNAFIPSLTLGCGSYGHNSVSNNVSAVNLINIKRVGRRNNNLQWFKVPAKTYFEPNAIRYLADMPDVQRVTIVTDATMTTLGFVDKIIDVLNRRGEKVALQIIDQVEPEPSVRTVQAGAAQMRHFRPDTIIALGGGSPMDAAKVMWLLYEHPEIDFSDLKQKFFDVRKRAFKFPVLGELAQLVCIPTTSGTGAEVTPFAVISDPEAGKKYPLADYALTPTVAIIDPVLTAKMPASLAADSGFDALTHATEAYVSVYANDFTDGMALQAIRLIFENLAMSVNGDPNDPATTDAREKMHNAGTIAGMSFGNAFLGIVHAMAHVAGSTFHLVHGRTNATLLPHVIRYNGTVPTKLTSWPKYEHYVAPERFQQIAAMLGLPAETPAQGVESYALAVEALRSKVGIPSSFQAQGVAEQEFLSRLDEVAMGAYEDQCAPANPRMPMIDDMKALLTAAYYGTSLEDVRGRERGRAEV